MSACCSRSRIFLFGIGFLLGAALLTWALVPDDNDQRQAARRAVPAETQIRTDVPPGTPTKDPAEKAKPEHVAGENNLPIKIRPIKSSLLNVEDEPMGSNGHDNAPMI